MAILCAYALPHPPLAIPAIGNGQEQKIKDTIAAFRQAAEEIAALAPDTIVVVTPHGTVYSDYFHISPGERASGDFSQFGHGEVKMDAAYDTAMTTDIAFYAENRGVLAGKMGEKDAQLDHGTMVPLWFINQAYSDYKLVRVSQAGFEPGVHYQLGQAIAEASEGKKVVLIASADLSHKLSTDGPYGYAEEGLEYDKRATGALASGDFLELFKIPESLREKAAECGHNSYMVLAGAFDKMQVEAKLISYEAPYGVGYAAASVKPKGADPNRAFIERFEEFSKSECERLRQSEDPYQRLARHSLESAVTGEKSPLDATEEMLNRRAGVFVSIHKHGRLRGCIGTISPTTENIAREIMQNAVSSGLSDMRFEAVEAGELPYLTYKVDILAEPEPIPNASYLDTDRYGVIVTAGNNRGLLLPMLDGIDTVEQQIAIARQKAGISESTAVELERFEVVRHG